MKRLLSAFTIIFIAVGLAACSNGGPETGSTTSVAIVAETGGRVEVPNGVVVTVAPGDLSSDSVVTVKTQSIDSSELQRSRGDALTIDLGGASLAPDAILDIAFPLVTSAQHADLLAQQVASGDYWPDAVIESEIGWVSLPSYIDASNTLHVAYGPQLAPVRSTTQDRITVITHPYVDLTSNSFDFANHSFGFANLGPVELSRTGLQHPKNGICYGIAYTTLAAYNDGPQELWSLSPSFTSLPSAWKEALVSNWHRYHEIVDERYDVLLAYGGSISLERLMRLLMLDEPALLDFWFVRGPGSWAEQFLHSWIGTKYRRGELGHSVVAYGVTAERSPGQPWPARILIDVYDNNFPWGYVGEGVQIEFGRNLVFPGKQYATYGWQGLLIDGVPANPYGIDLNAGVRVAISMAQTVGEVLPDNWDYSVRDLMPLAFDEKLVNRERFWRIADFEPVFVDGTVMYDREDLWFEMSGWLDGGNTRARFTPNGELYLGFGLLDDVYEVPYLTEPIVAGQGWKYKFKDSYDQTWEIIGEYLETGIHLTTPAGVLENVVASRMTFVYPDGEHGPGITYWWAPGFGLASVQPDSYELPSRTTCSWLNKLRSGSDGLFSCTAQLFSQSDQDSTAASVGLSLRQ